MIQALPVDPRDDELMQRWHDSFVASQLALDPRAVLRSLAEARELMTGDPVTAPSSMRAWLAVDDDGRALGASYLVLRNLDNTDRAHVVVEVERRHVATGALAVLHDAALADATRAGCTGVETSVDDRAVEQLAWLRSNGWRDNLVEVERHLDLPVPQETLARLEADAHSHVAPYRIESHVGPLPEAWLASFATVKNRMSTDSPHGDLELEPGAKTPDSLREQDRQLLASGMTRYTTVALAAGDVVLGCSELVTDGSDTALQWGTIVAPDARGHRLGMALKCAGLRLLAAHAPGIVRISTRNVETNAPMIAINEALGFRVASRLVELSRPL